MDVCPSSQFHKRNRINIFLIISHSVNRTSRAFHVLLRNFEFPNKRVKLFPTKRYFSLFLRSSLENIERTRQIYFCDPVLQRSRKEKFVVAHSTSLAFPGYDNKYYYSNKLSKCKINICPRFARNWLVLLDKVVTSCR